MVCVFRLHKLDEEIIYGRLEISAGAPCLLNGVLNNQSFPPHPQFTPSKPLFYQVLLMLSLSLRPLRYLLLVAILPFLQVIADGERIRGVAWPVKVGWWW